jgi:hypothetical protein
MAYLTGRLTGGAAPACVGEKFRADGQVRPWPGNTFVCHIPPGPAHEALTAAQAALRAGAHAGAFAFLPPASFHMTVFEGANAARRRDDSWPAGLSPDMALPEVTGRFLAALRPLTLPPPVSIRPAGLFGGFSVQVTGQGAADSEALRQMRAALSAATTIRRHDFAGYAFHITLAYLLRWLPEAAAQAVADLSDRVFDDLAAAVPGIALGPVEFCHFNDMHAFHLITRLTHAAD